MAVDLEVPVEGEERLGRVEAPGPVSDRESVIVRKVRTESLVSESCVSGYACSLGFELSRCL